MYYEALTIDFMLDPAPSRKSKNRGGLYQLSICVINYLDRV